MKIDQRRNLYSFRELYTITYQGFRSMSLFKSAQKNGLISEQLIERIMLAVTEVNGCEICSFAHTKMALEAGLSDSEIKNMLAGTYDDAPAYEMPAIMFAQHYADYRGRPSRESWLRLIEVYGLTKANAIVGTIRMIMMGNAYGIPWSSFFNRLKGKADKRSNIIYEVGVIFFTFIFMPAAYIHTFVKKQTR